MAKQTYIKELILENFKCFKGVNSFDFSKSEGTSDNRGIYQWTVFLGNNGTGKTNLLKALANLEPQHFTYNSKGKDGKMTEKVMYEPKLVEDYDAPSYLVGGWFVETENSDKPLIEKTYSYIGKYTSKRKRDGFPSGSLGYGKNVGVMSSNENFKDMKIYAYGVNRVASKSGLNTELGDTAVSLFRDDVKLLNFEDWLLQLELAKGNKVEGASNRLKLLKEIFHNSGLMPYIEDFSLVTDERFNNRILFKCMDGNFRFEELGYGYQSMLAWIFDFSKRMFDRYPNSDNPLHESAIVIIDEIDLHLHPRWQRQLLRALSRFFPNTQFIVSTHSPLIVQSMEGINLYVLRHQSDGSVVAERMENVNWEGWQMEEILQETMDVQDGYTSEALKNVVDSFNEACSNDQLEEAEKLFFELEKSVNPNGLLMQQLKTQIRDLRNYHEEN